MDKLTTDRDRDSAINWARILINMGEFVILDTETTGLDSAAEIIELGIIKPDGSRIAQSKFKPSPNAVMDERAFAVHGIALEDLQSSPRLPDYAQDLYWSIQGKTVICWNASFDYRMLIQSFNAWSVEPPPVIHLANFECAMLQHAKYAGDWDARHGQYRWQKLPGATHRGLADCRATLAVLQEMANARLSDEAASTDVNSDPNFADASIKAIEPEPAPAPVVRTIAFEHGQGSVTLGPAPTESTSTAVEVDDGTDPAANGYTFNMFESEDKPTAEYLTNLTHILNEAGAIVITLEHVTSWTQAQRIEAATWAAKTIVGNIDLDLTGLAEFPPWPDFFPGADIPF